MSYGKRGGPLEGLRVIELAGIGPGPFCAMLLADLGAEVVRVERSVDVRGGDPEAPPASAINRSRRSIGVNLKDPEGVETVLRLIEKSDVVLEGFRPGVVERLGVGPDVCLERNPKLVFGRMTGWGQDGPWANMAGHDINYIALSGTLAMIGRKGERPLPPLNLVGDFGGGGMMLAFGVLAALFRAKETGEGQVVDAAMVDGAALLATMMYGFKAMGIWEGGLGGNLLDTGAHFYEVYETSDGKHVALGAVESHFYAQLLEGLGIDPEEMPKQNDSSQWEEAKEVFAARIATKTRDEWDEIFAGTDACFAPVLEPEEAMAHPHNVERSTFTQVAGIDQPAPAPRFSATPAPEPLPAAHPGQHTEELLGDWGFVPEEIARLRDAGAIA